MKLKTLLLSVLLCFSIGLYLFALYGGLTDTLPWRSAAATNSGTFLPRTILWISLSELGHILMLGIGFALNEDFMKRIYDKYEYSFMIPFYLVIVVAFCKLASSLLPLLL